MRRYTSSTRLESISFRAGLTGGQRIVRWPYVAENDSIQPWVSGSELVLSPEQRLGYSLQDPFLRLNLQNALLIEQIIFHHHNFDDQAVTPDPKGLNFYAYHQRPFAPTLRTFFHSY